ncbi:MAG: hypothetical protein GY898_19875 [Proteobacteria bacterium]|nr:hypothetical protein [Pseudomonadota bacterium]
MGRSWAVLLLLMLASCGSSQEAATPADPPIAEPRCIESAWPAVEGATAPIAAPNEASSVSNLNDLAATLEGLPMRRGIPAVGAFPISAGALASAWPAHDPHGCHVIRRALGLDALPRGKVRAARSDRDLGSTRLSILLIGPGTGPFAAWVDLPTGDPRGAVLIRPGHSDSFADHDARIGDALRDAGWAQVHLQARLYQGSGEDEVTRAWLRAGSSLLAVRHIETVAVGAWVRQLPWARGKPLGVLGHSGGGVAACLTPRLFDGFDFVVSDFCADLALPASTERIGDGFHPELLPYRELLNDVDGLPTPTLVTPYNFDGSADAVVTWLSERRTR